MKTIKIITVLIIVAIIISSIFPICFVKTKNISTSQIINIYSIKEIHKDIILPYIDQKNIIWNNYPPTNASTAFTSQYDTAYPFQSQAADDFFFDENMQIKGVHWWGGFHAGGPPWPNPTDFNIIFYADDGTGNRPTGEGMVDPTSTALMVYFMPQVLGTHFGINDAWFEYNITLPEPFNVTANSKYWIAIQAVFDWPPMWAWFFNEDYPDQLHVAMAGFPETGMSYWTDTGYGDMAFYLTGQLSIPPLPPVIHGATNGDINHEYDFWTDPITDPSSDSLYIRWDWDDGNITDWLGPYSSGSIVSASHSWTRGGIYKIRAQLQGIGGQSNWSEPHIISIFQNTPPIANFTYTLDELTVTLDASSSYDPDGEITDWLWDFGDGTQATGDILIHTYQTSGAYSVTLTVKDDFGDTAQLTKNLSAEKYQKALILGRLQNTTYVGDTIAFTAINLKVITFQPFTFMSYKYGENIIIRNTYTGHLGYRFIFASCLQRV